MSDGDILRFTPKLVPKAEGEQPPVVVSEQMLKMAEILRDVSAQIEAGKVIAVGLVGIDADGDGLRAHYCEGASVAMVGMAFKMAHRLAEGM